MKRHDILHWYASIYQIKLQNIKTYTKLNYGLTDLMNKSLTIEMCLLSSEKLLIFKAIKDNYLILSLLQLYWAVVLLQRECCSKITHSPPKNPTYLSLTKGLTQIRINAHGKMRYNSLL